MKENTIQDRKRQLIVDQTVAPWCVCFNFNSVGPQKFRKFCDSEHKFLITVPNEVTIPDKTTWESFPHHVHFPTQQNYFQNDAFGERNPLPQFNVASYKCPGIRLPFEHTTTSLPGLKGEREEPVQLPCLEKCSPSTQFSQQFCPRL